MAEKKLAFDTLKVRAGYKPSEHSHSAQVPTPASRRRPLGSPSASRIPTISSTIMSAPQSYGNESLRIRRACPADLEACYEIETVCFEGAGAPRRRIAKRIRVFPQGFLVAVLEGKIVGFVNSGAFASNDIAEESLKDLEGHESTGANLVVFSLVVHPDARGRGIARELMERIIETAIVDDRDSVLLDCRKHLIPFYSSFGFAYRAPSPASFGGHAWHEMELKLKAMNRGYGHRLPCDNSSSSKLVD
jgi:ribosomal protein S18 acetylase RimI-like enzyme